jgi:flagellar motor switch protein FliN/FliY
MTEELQYEPLAASDSPPGRPGPGAEADLRRLSDVPVDLTVEIGRTRMTVGETLRLRPGSIVSLNRTAGEPVDLLVNGTRIARGEVVVVDEEFGLRITEVLHDADEPEVSAAAGQVAAAPAPPTPLAPGDDPVVDAVAA